MKKHAPPDTVSCRLMKAITRARFFILLVAVLSLPLISAASASYVRRSLAKSSEPAVAAAKPSAARPAAREVAPEPASFQPLLAPMPFLTGEDIQIYQSDCTTPATEFNLGQTVCAKLTGAPTGLRPTQLLRRIVLVGPSGYIRGKLSVPGNSSTASLTFTIPTNDTTVVGLDTVDNRGGWQAASLTSDGQIMAETNFTVSDPTNKAAELVLSEAANVPEIAPGFNITFRAYLSNLGPDDSEDVVFTAPEPANASFVSASAETGSDFTCTTTGGETTCSAESLPAGTTVSFTLTYDVSGAAPSGSSIVSATSVTSTTAQRSTRDKSAEAAVTVSTTAVPAACNLTCPANVVATANTTVGGQQGAFVTFGAASVEGNCGAVSNSPTSGSFFTVGTHTVTSSAAGDNGVPGDSCTFTVKVLDTPAPTISCPADKIATDTDSSGDETVAVGTPTFTASGGGTVAGVRSDSSAAEPKALNDPYPTGLTTITWTVTDADGRTASCTQRVNVNSSACGTDTQTPTITAPADVTVGTGAINPGCTVTLDDELGQPEVEDNCAVTVTITGAPAGNNFAPGTYTLTYTAKDGAGNHASDTQVVTVVDDTPPIIAAPPDAAYTCLNNVPAANANQARGPVVGPDGQFVRDTNGELVFSGPPFENCGTVNVSVSESATGVGSAASPRVITRTFTASDNHGNSSSAAQTITVTDPTPPTVALNGAASVTVECHTSFTDPGATASDNCGAASVAVTGSVNVNVPGIYTLTYTATDGVGNTASVQRTVTVVDTTPPAISCPADLVVDFNPAVGGAVVNYTAPSGTDSCAGVLTANQTTGLASGATFPLGTTTNTFVVTDGAGLTASCSFKVTVALTSIVGVDSVSITGAGPVDSYDSNVGYPASKGSLASVVSNGTITMTGSAKVAGNVRSTRAGVVMSGSSKVTGNATAGTTVSRSGSATVDGTITNNALAPVIALPAVSACGPPYSANSGISGSYSYNASTGDLSLSGVNIATLANGTYCFHNLSVGNSAQLKVNGPVTIKLTGTLSVSGAAFINNTTLIPSNLVILSSYGGSNGVSFGNSGNAHLLIYAPNTGVTISGASPLFGTAAGKSITISNSGMLHYDTRLQSVWPGVWQSIFGP